MKTSPRIRARAERKPVSVSLWKGFLLFVVMSSALTRKSNTLCGSSPARVDARRAYADKFRFSPSRSQARAADQNFLPLSLATSRPWYLTSSLVRSKAMSPPLFLPHWKSRNSCSSTTLLNSSSQSSRRRASRESLISRRPSRARPSSGTPRRATASLRNLSSNARSTTTPGRNQVEFMIWKELNPQLQLGRRIDPNDGAAPNRSTKSSVARPSSAPARMSASPPTMWRNSNASSTTPPPRWAVPLKTSTSSRTHASAS
mmetsp:Transcript_2352/g.7932  ORF Transcript_2352/g.7932 Transcript_2352/m.7932 type:complete len:259 (+) Transcript_2352:1392-2168(+)